MKQIQHNSLLQEPSFGTPDLLCGAGKRRSYRIGSRRFWNAEAFQSLLQRNGLDSLDGLFAIEKGHSLGKAGLPSWRVRIRLELADEGGVPRTYFLKRYTSPPLREQLRRILTGGGRHGTAWVEWNWMRRLAAEGIAAAEPVAFGEEVENWREERSALLTAAVSGQSLERFVDVHRKRADGVLLRRLARFVARLHNAGFVHRDLYMSHIFMDEFGEFRLIDLQRMMAPRWRRRRWVVKDLAALNYSTPLQVAGHVARLRFLREYGGKVDKRLVRDVMRKTRRVARREGRLGRLADWQEWLRSKK